MIEIANGDASRQGKDDWFHVTIVISNSERFPNGQSSSENASLVSESIIRFRVHDDGVESIVHDTVKKYFINYFIGATCKIK